MNIRLTSLHRHLAVAIAVACTLASVTSSALTDEELHPRVHRLANEERPHQEPVISGMPRDDRVIPERSFDMRHADHVMPEHGFNVRLVDRATLERTFNIRLEDHVTPEHTFDIHREDHVMPERGFNVRLVDRATPERTFNMRLEDHVTPERGFNMHREDPVMPERAINVRLEDRVTSEHSFNMRREDRVTSERGFDTRLEDRAMPERGFDMRRDDRVMAEHGFDMRRDPLPVRNEPAHFGPARGTIVTHLPPQTIVVQHAGVSYSIHDGVWYRPYGPRFTVVAAPIGAFVPVLPSFYTTVWFGGLPYYYADDVYYAWRPEHAAYEIVTPPPGAPEPVVNGDRLYAYPLNGQSPDQQARDRYDCHVWATDETGIDPSRTANSMTSTQSADYDRAMTACLGGRGYSVK
ncbi:DUF6515 family protein [Steroidobacter flavus]|uniref:DUF6515 family protein n=1 Tax=Steroidobacter flavus TaxID=1842136 RepID=A0ABV8T279_9GAMM